MHVQSYSSQVENHLDTHRQKTGYTNDNVTITQNIYVAVQNNVDPCLLLGKQSHPAMPEGIQSTK